ncbi:serine/threonine protein kinase, CMGC, CDC2/CDK subfamily [Pestalotiopsis sp. IQ-011]
MATTDWQTPLSAALGLLATGAVHIFAALSWVLHRAVVPLSALLYRAAAAVAATLTYPLYFVWRLLAFLLSPFWALGSALVGTLSWAVELAFRFKFATAALVGILTACVVHGTSNILFSILNIAPSSSSAEYDEKTRMRRLQVVDQSGAEYYESAPKEEYDDGGDASSSSSTDFENLLSEPASRRFQAGQPMMNTKSIEQAYRQARSTRLSPIKPSRRFRGLLAQTIHEESSESE